LGLGIRIDHKHRNRFLKQRALLLYRIGYASDGVLFSDFLFCGFQLAAMQGAMDITRYRSENFRQTNTKSKAASGGKHCLE
jgi:hypothetical protein